MKATFVPWYIEVSSKNTFLQSPIIVLQHIKNSVWAIEKLYRKTFVRKGFFMRNLHSTTIASVTQALLYPCLNEIQGSKSTLVHCFTQREYNSGN